MEEEGEGEISKVINGTKKERSEYIKLKVH